MQHYELASFQTFHHTYDTPTFKPEALRLLVMQGVKHLLLQYKQLI